MRSTLISVESKWKQTSGRRDGVSTLFPTREFDRPAYCRPGHYCPTKISFQLVHGMVPMAFDLRFR